jgi:hypothetical protein
MCAEQLGDLHRHAAHTTRRPEDDNDRAVRRSGKVEDALRGDADDAQCCGLKVINTGRHLVKELGRHSGNLAEKTVSLGSDPSPVHDDAPPVDDPDSLYSEHKRQQLAPSGDTPLGDPEVERIQCDGLECNEDFARASDRRIDVVQLDVAAKGVDAGGLHEAKALT